MSLVEEGPLCWTWIGLKLPSRESVDQSPTFIYQGREWYLKCSENVDGIIYVLLILKHSEIVSLQSFSTTVKIRGMNPKSKVPSSQTELWNRSVSSVIWRGSYSEVEKFISTFRLNRFLTFQIRIIEHHPLIDSNSACASAEQSTLSTPRLQSEAHSKTFADASVQTSLTTNSILCLDALSEDFAKMMDADSDLDVEIHCGDHSTRAHKNILCSRSPVLAKMLQTDMVEGRMGVVNIRDMDADTFQQFLRYLYTGKLDDVLTFDAVLSLYEAGDMYGVISLRRLCSDYLKANLTVGNACKVLVVADAHSDSNFTDVVTSYILDKEIPQSSDQWPAFCDRQPAIALRVLNRFVRR